MKIKIISIIVVASLLMSCSDFLDRNSQSGVSEKDFWKTEKDAISGVNAIYNTNREFTSFILPYGMLDDFTDISYRSLAFGMTTGIGMTSEAEIYTNSWGVLFKGIYRANAAIKYIPQIQGISQEIADRSLGEALFFRGYFYFKLWDLYGGVPIFDFPIKIEDSMAPRNTEQEVYEFIIKDLTDASELLSESYTDGEKGRVTKWAALAMRGKAHLWAKKYKEAASDFKNVMDNSDRELLTDYHQLFRVAGNNNDEVIFDVQYVAVEGHGINTDFIYGNAQVSTKGSQISRPTPQLVNAYEMLDGSAFDLKNYKDAKGEPFYTIDPKDPPSSGDPNDHSYQWNDEVVIRKIYEGRDARLQQSIITPWSTFVGGNNTTLLYKFPVDESDSNAFVPVWKTGSYSWRKFVETGSTYTLARQMPQNIPLIRLADVMLMYAEAANESEGPGASVYEAMNKVRQRAKIADLASGLSKDQMREKIRHERMVELAGEGQRYSDIRRWRIAKDVVDGLWMTEFTGIKGRHKKGFPNHFYLWPIPQNDINTNKNLKQNPGWD